MQTHHYPLAMSQSPDHKSEEQKIEIHQNVGTNFGEVVGVKHVYPTSPRDKNLDILLSKVKEFWVEGVLEKSLYNEVLIELDMVGQPDAIDHPWDYTLERPDRTSELLGSGKKIDEVFDEVGRSLLILGAPGSGKTITLLELARSLIEKAEIDRSEPVPVVFNLSSWTSQRLSLFDWIIQEFMIKYNVPERFSKAWLKENSLILLLDGFDEINVGQQVLCVDAINSFIEQHGVPGIIVCSRITDYANLSENLRFGGAILIKELRKAHIESFIQRAGNKLNLLGKMLENDKELLTMAKTPIMLSVMSMAYQEIDEEVLIRKELALSANHKSLLFNTYIKRMLSRKGKNSTEYSARQVIKWLSWLGKEMQDHSKTVFHMEEFQRTWLNNRKTELIYTILSRLIGGLIIGLIGGIIIGIIGSIMYGVKDGIGDGLLGGAIIGIPGMILDSFRVLSPKTSAKLERINELLEVLIYGIMGGIMGAIIISWSDGQIFNLRIGMIDGLVGGLIGGSFWGIRRAYQFNDGDIRSVERLTWSGRSAIQGSISGIVIGIIIGSIGWFTDRLQFLVMDGSIYALIGGLSGGLSGLVIEGLRGTSVNAKNKVNQGIELSLKNSAIGALIGMSIFGIIGLLFWGVVGEMIGLIIFIVVGGFIAFLWYGGQDAIQHYTIRILLRVTSQIPLRLPRFLDYAAQIILLRKVGGGYIFIHRMLLEHFADMYEEKK